MEGVRLRGVGYELYAVRIRKEVPPVLPEAKPRRRYRLPVKAMLALVALVSLFVVAWPFVPALKLPLQQFITTHPSLEKSLPAGLQPPGAAIPTQGNWLIIPSINVKEEVWEGSTLDVLNTHQGVWHQTGNLEHNLVLAGHRFQYLPPNTDTFYNLNRLKTGDKIIVVWTGVPHNYIVVNTQVVTPQHVEILNQTVEPELTLYTCNDWKTTQRLVVLAVPAE